MYGSTPVRRNNRKSQRGKANKDPFNREKKITEITNVVRSASFPRLVIFLHQEVYDRWVSGQVNRSHGGPPSQTGPRPRCLVEVWIMSRSIFPASGRFRLGPSGKIGLFSDFPRILRSAGYVCWERKVIRFHYHEANPALVPWEIVGFGLIPPSFEVNVLQGNLSLPQIVSYFWAKVITGLICVLSWNKTKHLRFIVWWGAHRLWKLTGLSVILRHFGHVCIRFLTCPWGRWCTFFS